jgi:Sulfatase
MTAPAPSPPASRRRPLAAHSWLAAGLAAAQLTLVGPALILLDNRREFIGASWSNALYLLVAFALLTALLVAPALLVRGLAERWRAALLALTVVMWGQSFVTGRYGLLDGTRVDWSASRGQEIVGWVVWVAALGVAVMAARRLLPWLWRGAALVLAVQVGAALLALATAPPVEAADRDVENLSRFAQLSPERNVIVLVLDAVRGRAAEDVLQADEAMRRRFAGFRLFSDHVAAFPTTRFSVPAMLSTARYDNREPASDYVERALQGEASVTARLQAAGFDVGVASTVRTVLATPADVVVAAEHYSLSRNRRDLMGLELLDLSLFRHLPLTLKRWVFNDDEWRVRRLFGSAADYHATRSQRFVSGLVERLRPDLARPAFRFVHVGGAHVPVVVDAECRFLGVQPETEAGYRDQVACALRQALQLVDGLEAVGLLDATFLVVTSDHGTFLQDAAAVGATPVDRLLATADSLLMVKPFGARGELVVDPRPTAAVDLPALVATASTSEAGAGPDDLIPPSRADGRPAYYYEWQNKDWRLPYLTCLHEFRVDPGASRRAAWHYVGSTPSPELSAADRAEQMRIGRRMADILSQAAGSPR